MSPPGSGNPRREQTGAAREEACWGAGRASASESTAGQRQALVGPAQPTLDEQPPERSGAKLRDEGAAQALDAAPIIAVLAAEAVIRRLARSGREFDAETVRDAVGAPLGCRPAVLGALFLAAARRGEIIACGFRQATRPEARRRILRVWRGTGHG